jgi:hypothetical protein
MNSTRIVVGWAAVLGTVPYLALKFAWLAGSSVGVLDVQAFDVPSVVALNALTAAMDVVAIVVALAFTYPWGLRVPALLVLVPIWVGTGFLAPIVLLLPMAGFAAGAPPPDPVLASWVQPMVYTSFGWQGLMLMIAFVLYARVRWPWVFQVERLAVRRVPVVLGDAGAVVGVVAVVLLLTGGTAIGVVQGLMAIPAVAGVVVLVHGVRCRFWVPVVVTWLGAGALFSWGMWGLLNSMAGTALSNGELPLGIVAASVAGLLIGLGSLVLLSGYRTATAAPIAEVGDAEVRHSTERTATGIPGPGSR